MKINRLHESNELHDRAKKHKKNNRGLSPHCKLNPDAGNVEHNVSMFNKMNSPVDSPSNNPISGPHGGDVVGESVSTSETDILSESYSTNDKIQFEYDNLPVTYQCNYTTSWEYGPEWDECDTRIDYTYEVDRSTVEEELRQMIIDNMSYEEYESAGGDDGIDVYLDKLMTEKFDELVEEHMDELKDIFEDAAIEDAKQHYDFSADSEPDWDTMPGGYDEKRDEQLSEKLVESVTPAVEDFLIDLGQTQDAAIYKMYLRKNIDRETCDKLNRLRISYKRHAELDNESSMQRCAAKVKELLNSCPDKVYEDMNIVSNQYVVMAVTNDGKKQYYNVDSKEWVPNGKDATIFDDMDAARLVWFKLNKKPFKRVFTPIYDAQLMNEEVLTLQKAPQQSKIASSNSHEFADLDTQFEYDNFVDKIDDIINWEIPREYKITTLGHSQYDVCYRNGKNPIRVKFDVKNRSNGFVFTIDGKEFRAKNERDAGKIITDAARKKHFSFFDLPMAESHKSRNDQRRENEVCEDVSKEWKPNTSFNHIQAVYEKVKANDYKYVNNEREEFMAAVKKADSKGYKPEQCRQIREWHKDIWKHTRKSENLSAYGRVLDESKVPDNWTKDKKLKQYFREGAIRYQVIVDAITPNYVVSEHEFLRDAIDAAREEIDLNWASNVRIKDLSDGACWHDIENAEADLRDGIVDESWSPELVDCPVCGDISFDSRKGRCTQCSYREALDEFSDELDHPDQEFDSAKTSINSAKLPAVYRMVKIPQGTTGVDFGGGSFDNAVEHIRDLGATLCVYDPYNRSADHNSEVLKTLKSNGGADWAINSNVLNVIKEPEARKAVLKNISRITKSGAPVYITVYEGRGDGQEGATKSGYQLNRKTQDYLSEIQEVFPDAVRKGKLIVAHNGSGHVNESNNAYSYKDCTIIDVGSGWKVKDASQKWVGNEFATNRDAEEFVDSLKESFLDSDDNYAYVASKSVLDSDGFYTDYTWYKNQDGLNVFVFGDSDIYKPEDGYIDHEEEDDTAAQEWFDDYNGFEEDVDCVVAYTGKKESLKEWNEFSDDDVEDDLTHAAVYGGDSKYCKECGAVKKYDEDGFAYCPECCGELDESYWYPELRQKQDDLIAELESDGWEEVNGISHGSKHWTFFRKIAGSKGIWKAIFVDTEKNSAEVIDVTYGQARGFEPLDNVDALRKELGQMLLP